MTNSTSEREQRLARIRQRANGGVWVGLMQEDVNYLLSLLDSEAVSPASSPTPLIDAVIEVIAAEGGLVPTNWQKSTTPVSPVPPEQIVKEWEPRINEMVDDLIPATPTPVEQEQENRGIKSSALLQRYARMWSSTEGIEKRFSLQDRYIAVRTCVHAIDRLAERDDLTFDVRANAQGILRDGIYNALDHRATGREWRNIRHTYWNERDGPYPPTEAEEDRRCERCGAIRPEPFTHCHAKNHVPAVPPSRSVREAVAKEIAAWIFKLEHPLTSETDLYTTQGIVQRIIERHCSSVSAAPVFKNTKEAMEYAARHNMQSVIPVSAAGGDEDDRARHIEFFCHWLLRAYEAIHRDTSYQEGENFDSIAREINQVLGFAGYEPESAAREQLLAKQFSWNELRMEEIK